MVELNELHRDDASLRTVDRAEGNAGQSLGSILRPIGKRWISVLAVTVLGGALSYGGSFLLKPIFSGTTIFMPPQQQQGGLSSALASLGALGSLAGGAVGVKNPADQFASMLQTEPISDRIIEKFKLKSLYDMEFMDDTRTKLSKRTDISVGKKDGLIYVTVEDEQPQRAADMANQYLAELQRLTSGMAITEAQQRRVFYEAQLKATQVRLTAAQVALQGSGINENTLKGEPAAAAGGYARLKAELMAAQVRLQTLRESMSDSVEEVRQQRATVEALSAQVEKLERTEDVNHDSPDYIGKYREFKYQETLFDLMARQYEIARVDESREGSLIQVVQLATPAEHRDWPRRGRMVLAGAVGLFLLYSIFIVVRSRRSQRADLG